MVQGIRGDRSVMERLVSPYITSGSSQILSSVAPTLIQLLSELQVQDELQSTKHTLESLDTTSIQTVPAPQSAGFVHDGGLPLPPHAVSVAILITAK